MDGWMESGFVFLISYLADGTATPIDMIIQSYFGSQICNFIEANNVDKTEPSLPSGMKTEHKVINSRNKGRVPST